MRDVIRDLLRGQHLAQLALRERQRRAVPVRGAHHQLHPARRPRRVGDRGVVQTRHERHWRFLGRVVHGHGVGGAHGEDHAVREVDRRSRLGGDGGFSVRRGFSAAIRGDGHVTLGTLAHSCVGTLGTLRLDLLIHLDLRFLHRRVVRSLRRGCRGRVHPGLLVQRRREPHAHRGGDARQTHRGPGEPPALVEVRRVFLTLVRFPVHAGGNREERSARRPRQPPEERFQRIVLEEQPFRSHRASYLLLAHQLLAPAAQLRRVHGHLGSRGRGVHVDLSIARRGSYEFALGIPRHALDVVLVSLEADQPARGGLAPHDG